MSTKKPPKTPTAKVGDVAPLDGFGFVVLPDGGVVSAVREYTFRHVGEHRVDGRTIVVEPLVEKA